MVARQWTRKDVLVWYELRSWSLWQRALWALIRWTPFAVRVMMSRDGRRPYLLRATLWPRLSPWLSPVYLHYAFQDDEEGELHNHPWTAISLILSRGYYEERWSPLLGQRYRIRRRPGNVVLLRRDTYHRILTGHWFSLFIPFRRISLPEEESWRFLDPESGQSWPWARYVARRRANG